jgi:UDP-N-acetyl-D-glucosamine dehydrogenase
VNHLIFTSKRNIAVANTKHLLLEKITSRTARVGVIGLGYVGLPLVVEFAGGGFNSTGFEVDERKAGAINRGESYIPDVPTAHVAELVAAKRLSATTDFTALKEQDIIIICVPTPLRKTKEPDVSFILAASEKIQATLRPGQLIILESTTYPGTTDEVLKPIFDETGLKLDEDYFLAFSPERVDPGNEKFNTKNITKVVGGVTATSADVAAAAYSKIVDKVHPVSSARVAECCKLLENTFRAVNIGLVNEMAMLCQTLGIDTWEVIAAAATKPFGFMPFYPGPGIGGHCIPLDPHYLSWKARMHGFEARFISLAEEVNSRMPEHVVEMVSKGLNNHRKPVNGSKVLIMGVAYKRDIDDMRESPALAIIEQLQELGAEVSFHDPYVPEIHLEGNGHHLRGIALSKEVIAEADCVVIVTDHRNIDYGWVAEQAKLVVDTRNTTRDLRDERFDGKIIRL